MRYGSSYGPGFASSKRCSEPVEGAAAQERAVEPWFFSIGFHLHSPKKCKTKLSDIQKYFMK
jgi:hypothetical protein